MSDQDHTSNAGDTNIDLASEAPLGCEACTLGVRVDDREIAACGHCSLDGLGHRDDRAAASFVLDSLRALADIRDILWPAAAPETSWSPDTLDEIAGRMRLIRPADRDVTAAAVRYSGAVTVELTYDDSDLCYDGRVIADGHTYSVSVYAPKAIRGVAAYDSSEAYDQAAHAALSFAAADMEWGEGRDIFSPAAETNAHGWVIRRRRAVDDDRTAYYRRALARQLDAAGWPRVDRRLTKIETPPRDNAVRRREILRAWLRDALLWSLEELAEERPLYAFRGLLQAAGYAAEVGHDVLTSDTMSFLRNAIEDVITRRT
jgi:hypothetical protein